MTEIRRENFASLVFLLGMAFVDKWVVGKEKVGYWLSNDGVELVGNLAV